MTHEKNFISTVEDDALIPLVERVLAARPATKDELDDLAEAIGWHGETAIRALQQLGLIETEGARVTVSDPAKALAAGADGALEQAQSSFEDARRLLGILAKVKDVPREASSGSEMISAVIRDHDRVWESWWENHSQLRPNRPGVVTPDTVMLKNQVLEDIDRVAADFIERDFHMRVILDIEECTDEDGSLPTWITRQLEAGVEIRAMAKPPSWFYVDDGVMGGIPLTWGQGNPAGMIVIQPSPLLTMAAAFFETLWARAVPIRIESEDGWEPVMRLLEVGRSDKQIADALGIGLRTVRRRISEAMDELGATTRFELGMCWAQRHA